MTDGTVNAIYPHRHTAHLAACCAYFITYLEWKHHYPRGSNKPRDYALEAALVTLVMFIILTVITVVSVKRILNL